MIRGHLTEFAGLPVADSSKPSEEALATPSAYAWAVRAHLYREQSREVFARFLETVDTKGVEALVLGFDNYEDHLADPVRLLTAAADALPALRAVFLGDMVMEEREISWIEQSDITPVLAAFPRLEQLEIRGAEGLVLEPVRHDALRRLRFESGGLPAHVVRAVGASDLPNLEHLDFWLGVDEYGGDATVADLAPFLSGERFPALRHLGLEDARIQDEIAAAIAGAPVVAQLESLSLGMGALTDAGAEALLSGQPLGHLKKLDLHHHFLTDGLVERVRAALPGVEVDLSDRQEDEDWLFVEVSE